MKRVTYFIGIFALFTSCTALAKDISCAPSIKGTHTSAAPSCPSPLLPESERCHKLYEESEYAAAFPICSTLAENNDSLAQSVLGLMYYEGKGITANYPKALYWIKKSAEAGNPAGEHNLGLLYEEGLAIKQDNVKAFEWYEKAAQHNASVSQAKVADLYMKGQGIASNKEKAFYWAKKSAEQHNAIGELNLAICYAEGIGVGADLSKAFYWVKKSAEQGNSSAQFMVGLYMKEGEGMNKNLIEAYKWFYLASKDKNNPLNPSFNNKIDESLEQLSHAMTVDEINKAKFLADAWKPIITDKAGKNYYQRSLYQ